METMKEILDLAKERGALSSDYALSKRLKVSRAAVSAWRHENNMPDAVSCAKLAEIAGIPLARVLGIVGEARAISREEKAVWRRLASAAAIACLMLVSLPSPASIRDGLTEGSYSHYAK